MFDHLFDKGMMTFDINGHAILSSALSHADVQKLVIADARAAYPLGHHEPYLAYHRSDIFIP
ncbi:hypothetical protein D3C72_2268050 [compost metagenome]